MGKKAMIGAREVRFGLAVIGVLLVGLVVVVARRVVVGPWLESDVAVVAADDDDAATPGGVVPAEFHAGPHEPTVLKARASLRQLGTGNGGTPPDRRWTAAGGGTPHQDEDDSGPRNYMPKVPLSLQSQPAPEALDRPAADGHKVSDGNNVDQPTLPDQEPRGPVPAVTTAGDAYAETTAAPKMTGDPLAAAGPRYEQAADAEIASRYPSHRVLRPSLQPTASGRTEPAMSEPAAPAVSRRPPTTPVQAVDIARAEPRQEEPIRPNSGTYKVQPGDSVWLVSRKVYGTGALFKALAEHNRERLPMPHRLAVGQQLLTPDIDVLRKQYPNLCPKPRKRPPATSATTMVSSRHRHGGRTYVVEEGDTLYDIARYELGSAGRWPEIHALNQAVLGEDFDYLRPGTRLILPSPPASDPITRRPSREIRRY